MNTDWSANSVCSPQLNMHTHTHTFYMSVKHNILILSSRKTAPLCHPVIAWCRISGWYSVCSMKTKYDNSHLTICIAKREISLNNSPLIYTRTKKKEQSDLNKNSIEKGRWQEVHSCPQSTIHIISYWTEITDSPAGNKSLGQSIWQRLLQVSGGSALSLSSAATSKVGLEVDDLSRGFTTFVAYFTLAWHREKRIRIAWKVKTITTNCQLCTTVPSKTYQAAGLIASHQSLVWVKVKVKSLSHVWLFATPWTVDYQAPPSMGFSKQEYCSGLPFPSPGDIPNPGIEPGSPTL